MAKWMLSVTICASSSTAVTKPGTCWPEQVRGTLKVSALEITPFIPNGSTSLLALGDYTLTFGDAPPHTVAGRFIDHGHGHRLWTAALPAAVVALAVAGAMNSLVTLAVAWFVIGVAGPPRG